MVQIPKKTKVLILDVETSPNLAYVWRLFKENVGVNQLVNHSELLSYAAKWLGDDHVMYDDARNDENDHRLLHGLCNLLGEADMVVAHNGRRFDLKQIRGRAVVNGLPPFAPPKVIDTLDICKKEFGFASASLAFLCNILKVPVAKGEHKKFPGFTLWAQCMKGNMAAWDEMKEYNILDIVSLEQVYLTIRGWATDHPNVGVFEDVGEFVCPKCGGNHLQRRGSFATNVAKYQRYRCNDCGGWSRSRFKEEALNPKILFNAR